MDTPISEQDKQLIQTSSTMATVAYSGTPPRGWQLIKNLDGTDLIANSTNGFQAQAYISSDPSDKRIFVAVAGTNDGQDVAAWSSAVTGWNAGAPQFEDGINFAAKVNNLVKDAPQYAGYSISTSGHSFGEGFAQMFSHAFGWSGVGFDGIGAGAIIGSAGYTQYLASQNITAVGGTNFISCNTAGLFNTSGLLIPGGGLVGSIGSDIQGTRQCTVNVDGGLASGLLGLGLTIELGPVGFVLDKLFSGASLHSMEMDINPAIQSGHFTVDPVVPAAPQPFTYNDGQGNIFQTKADAQGNVLTDANGQAIFSAQVTNGNGSVTQCDFTASGQMLSITDSSTPTTGAITNLFTSTITTPSLTSHGTPDPTTTVNQNGTAAAGGTWTVSTDATLLNTSTRLVDAIIGDALTGGIRPGNGVVSGTSTVLANILNSANMTDAIVASTLGTTPPPSYNHLLDTSLVNLANSGSSSKFVPADPLILDLNGDGVKLTSYQDKTVLFDIDHDGGSKEQTGWIAANTTSVAGGINTDGIVVMDLNGNGKIDDISETMSEYFNGTVGTSGNAGSKPFTNGFTALKSLDSNGNNQLDSGDTAWANVKVWVDDNTDGISFVDTNGNGILDAGEVSELKTLTELGITSINLAQTIQSGLVNGGNEVLASGSFVQNGITQAAQTANFMANPLGQTFSALVTGTRIDSQTASGSNSASYISHLATGEVMDATTLGVANLTGNAGNDTLTGDAGNNWLMGSLGSDTFNAGAGDDVLLIDAADLQANIHAGAGNDIAMVVGDVGVTLNLAQAEIEVAVGGRGNDIFIGGGRSSVFVRGGDGDDIVIGGGANDALNGENGNDLIDGGAGNDLIRGGRGQDQLLGGVGDDILMGGQDDDSLSGGAGNDVLKGEQGDDVLDGGDGVDFAEFTGSFADYRITKLDDATYRVVDTRAGRDGADILKNIEKLNFADVSGLSLETNNISPLVVKDVLGKDTNNLAFDHTQAHVINASQLLANDIDWAGKAMRVLDITDVQGGTISNIAKAADGIAITSFTFTPDAKYQGVMGFKYSIVDSDNIASRVTDPNGNAATMKALVTLRTPDMPTDALITDQWYLSEANILPVWKDYTGKNIHIAQFEMGMPFATDKEVLDVTHPDLKPNLDQSWLADPNNPIPQTYSNHATLVAGVMVGARNGEGGVGVAYDAKVAGYWLANSGNTPTAEYSNLFKMKDYDIANNSWGFANTFGTVLGSYQEQVDAATLGRKGLGTVMVFGAGNDRANGGNANYSNLSNSRYAIAVGAINTTSDIGSLQFALAPFSNPGANILVSAAGSNITSTSSMLMNSDGSTFGSDYTTVQGTSFATPVVSGIVALMLEANPNLGYRDVQEILALSAKKIDDGGNGVASTTVWQTNHATNWNGGGMHVSHDYGFGEVDALAAVRMAETWKSQQTTANEAASALAGSGNINLAVPDNNATGITSSLTVSNTPLKVEHAEVTVNLTHANAGDLIVKLISPTGTESILMNRPGQSGSNTGDAKFNGSNTLNFTFDTVRDWGESANGIWKLQVIDAATGAVGTLNSWSIKLYGVDDTSNNDQYVYTNEYSKLIAADTTRGTLNDTDGGTDTINAAAIGGVVNINLTTGVASLNGAALTISNPANIENAIGGEYNDTLTGNAASNRLFGGRGNDVIDGGAGSDLIDGGLGADVLTGGTGSDYFVIRANDTATDTINDFVAGTDRLVLMGLDGVTASFVQQGTDTKVNLNNGQSVLLKNVTATSLSATSLLHVPDMPISNLYQNIFFGSDGNDTIYGLAGGDRIYGGAGNDEVVGGAGGDTLIGGDGADYILGNAGDDVIYLEGDYLGDVNANGSNASVRGGSGADQFVLTQTTAGRIYTNFVWDFEVGQAGSPVDLIDLSRISQATSFAKLAISTGNLLDPTGGTSLIAEVKVMGDALNRVVTLYNVSASQLRSENFVFAQAVAVPFNPNINGTSGNDIVTGDAGANTLDGGAGADAMTGRTGDDTYIVDNPNDTVNELPGGGFDTVRSSVTYTLSANVENMVLTGAAAINATGNELANRLTGNTADNVLNGMGGADTMLGGAGNDSYVVDSQADTVIEYAAEGTDTVQASVSYTLGNNIENLQLTGIESINATGNDLVNALTGNSGDNIIDGAAGADSMAGGVGDDTYIVDNAGDVVTENLNEGIDTVYAAVNYTLSANIENLVLMPGTFSGTGNALDNLLTGNSTNNTLTGGAGNDWLDGKLGADILIGGTGNDTYVVDNTGDIVTEALNEGIDTVQSSISYALAANVENLTLIGTTEINGTGNDLNNTIIGNAATNILTGGLGADTLIGGAGNDLYWVDNALDVVVENANTGMDFDTVKSSVTYTLPANAEVLVLTGSSAIDGNTSNDAGIFLYGNSGNNQLTGGAGRDVLDGGKGFDTYYAGNGDQINDSDGQGAVYLNGVLISGTFLLTGDTYLNNALLGISIKRSLTSTSCAFTITDAAKNTLTLTNFNAGSLGITLSGYNDPVVLDLNHDGLINSIASSQSQAYFDFNYDGIGERTGWIAAGDGFLVQDVNQNGVIDNIGELFGNNASDGFTNLRQRMDSNLDGAITASDSQFAQLRVWQDANGDGYSQATELFSLSQLGIGRINLAAVNTQIASADNLITGTSSFVQNGLTYLAADINLAINFALNNAVRAVSGSNLVTGTAGNDVLMGNPGSDILNGGAGNDVYLFGRNDGQDTVANNDPTVGKRDVIRFQYDVSPSDVIVSRDVNHLILTVKPLVTNLPPTPSAGSPTRITVLDYFNNDGVSPSGIEVIEFSNGTAWNFAAVRGLLPGATDARDVLYGFNTDDTINGLGGDDYIEGRGGNDYLDGGAGSDTLVGGLGNDTYVVDNIGDVVTENLNEGTDTVQSSMAYTLGSNVENLTLTGLAAINGTGNSLNNLMVGNAAANLLDGGLGADTLIGGAGDDSYVVDNVADVVIENLNEGTDSVRASLSYALSNNVENLTLTGLAVINGTGNTLNNVITGNAADNVLDGGIGSDTLLGGAGNDTYIVDNAADSVVENLNEGSDTVQSSVSYVLGANIETLMLTGYAAINGTGNDLANVIYGNYANNVLNGGAGVDYLYDWYGGNDTYQFGRGFGQDYVYDYSTVAGSLDSVQLGAGITAADITVSRDVYHLYLSINGTADKLTLYYWFLDAAYKIEQVKFADGTVWDVAAINALAMLGTAGNDYLVGTAGADTLNGLGGDDQIFGNDGNDLLNGGTGADTLVGGLGNDTYVIDNVGDVVSETSTLTTEIDTVQSSISYTLGSNLENLILTGTAALNGTGNASNNVLTGNSAANLLDGSTGADTLIGGAGNDTYVVDNIGDVVSETSTLITEIDTVQSAISYTLGANVENLSLIGTAAINGTGNALNNVLVGNVAANILTGGSGDDLYVVGAGDTVIEGVSAGVDTVQSLLSYTLGANVENLMLMGSVAINGIGNGLNNVLTGNAASNVLTGGVGADTFVFNTPLGAANVDSITDFTHGSDRIQLALSIFGNAGAVGGLSNTAFASGAGMMAATTVDQHILYNSSSGALYYDADGVGGLAAVAFATLLGVPAVTAADFVLM